MRRKKINLKGIVCALMSSAMILTLVTPASAATARATTMKLEKTEGTVTLKTQNGSERKITTGMRLYNGNALETAKYSYAHISLDSTKAVKLDQSSSATLRQSGKQLELLVKSGKLFFNVNKKLDSNESMNVRTSTMVTGIRGTCGVVEYVDVNKSKLYLIEGQVTLGSGDNVTTVYGGQTATVVLQPKQETGGSGQPGSEDKPGEPEKPGETDKEMEQKVMVETLTEKQIPPVALQEIVADPVLQEKIEQNTELKIEKIEEALEQFEKEEAERIEQEKEEQEKEEEKDQEKEEDEKKEDESTTSSGGGSYTPSTPAPTTATLSGAVSAAAINAALASYNTVTLDTAATAELEADVTIPAGKTLIVNGQLTANGGRIDVGSGMLISNSEIKECVSDSALVLINQRTPLIYAPQLNTQVANYLNELAKSAAITAAFQRDTSVTSSISLSGSSNQLTLNMSTNTLKIESGTLTLASNVSIVGALDDGGDSANLKAVVLLEGGNLVMQGTSTSAEIKNTGSAYAIARTNGGTSGTVTWNDRGLSVSGKNDANTAINGAEVDGEIVKLPGWVQTSYVPTSQNGKITLQSVPAEFTSGTVSAADLNKSLIVYQTVTVGPDAKANLSATDTVTVPAGKTLNIQSVEKPIGNNQYSGGFYLNGGTLTLRDGATLNVSGVVGRSGTINVGETSGAKVSVAAGATLSASRLTLKAKSVINNSGTVDVGTIETDGTENITNNALIKTQEYKNCGSGTGSYTGTNESVLVNNTKISNGPSELKLLAYANTSETDTNGLQYFYTSFLGSLMANRINTIKTFSGVDALKNADVVWWHFDDNALVPSGTKIELTDLHANMGAKELQVAGTLTLSGAASVTGTGEATVRLQGGTLNLGATDVDSEYGEIKNTSTTGYAIANDSNNSGTLNWKNKSYHIIAEGGFTKTLFEAGLTQDTTTTPAYVTVPSNSYVKLVEGKLDWNSERKELRYVPANFLNTSETVGKEQIEWSLGANCTMTIGKGVTAQLTKEDSVTISQGKTLKIQTDNFSMAAGSSITIEAGGTLIVEGNITGNGTINVSASGAILEVPTGGSVTVDALSTSNGSTIIKNGTIIVAGVSYSGA